MDNIKRGSITLQRTVNTICFLLLAFFAKSQGQQFSLPNKFNKFILNENVTWAAELEYVYQFDSSKKIEDNNIYDELVMKANAGQLKAHIPFFSDLDGFSNGNYSRFDNYAQIKVGNEKDMAYILADTLKRIKLFEILYIENHKLKSRIISAAPSTNFASNGVSLGSREIFYCCKNETGSGSLASDIFIKEFKREIILDSVTDFRVIKETFGLNLIQSLWIGASVSSVKVINVDNNKIIPAKQIINYSLTDSTEIPKYNANGGVVGKIKTPGQPVFPLKFINKILFTVRVFYNPKEETFNSIITDCFLFTAKWDKETYERSEHKSFKMLFD